MATARKPAVDPLIEELPAPSAESKPGSSKDVFFDVEITSYVYGGGLLYKWTIVDHNAKSFVDSYVGHSSSGFESVTEAEFNATDYVRRIREVIDLKLSRPQTVTITL